ncbi:translation initiation factor IF-2-like [Lagopus muta]|uniref:translation initiation factor IF-2-like n=1 Tax=Lagopus muta TaxID=64668 RepID=UPI0020A0C534|nr:translation initiation factor IF-2-like [Lagopus muta]
MRAERTNGAVPQPQHGGSSVGEGGTETAEPAETQPAPLPRRGAGPKGRRAAGGAPPRPEPTADSRHRAQPRRPEQPPLSSARPAEPGAQGTAAPATRLRPGSANFPRDRLPPSPVPASQPLPRPRGRGRPLRPPPRRTPKRAGAERGTAGTAAAGSCALGWAGRGGAGRGGERGRPPARPLPPPSGERRQLRSGPYPHRLHSESFGSFRSFRERRGRCPAAERGAIPPDGTGAEPICGAAVAPTAVPQSLSACCPRGDHIGCPASQGSD